MAISLVGNVTAEADNPTSGNFTLPAGWASGDIGLFFWLTFNFGKTFTKPASVEQTVLSSVSSDGTLFLGYRWLQSGDTTFGWTSSSVASSGTVWGVVAFRGVKQQLDGTPWESTVGPTTNLNIQNPPANVVTIVLPGSLAFELNSCVAEHGKSGTWPFGSGENPWFEAVFAKTTLSNGCVFSSAYYLNPPPGALNPGNWNFTGGSTDDHQDWAGVMNAAPDAGSVGGQDDAGYWWA